VFSSIGQLVDKYGIDTLGGGLKLKKNDISLTKEKMNIMEKPQKITSPEDSDGEFEIRGVLYSREWVTFVIPNKIARFFIIKDEDYRLQF